MDLLGLIMDVGHAETSILVLVVYALIREGIPAMVKFLPALSRYRKNTSEADRKSRKDEISEAREREAIQVANLQDVVKMLQQDAIDYRKQLHDLRDEVAVYANKAAACEVREARKDERILALEDALRSAKIPFRDSGSNTHPVLPPEDKSPKGKRSTGS